MKYPVAILKTKEEPDTVIIDPDRLIDYPKNPVTRGSGEFENNGFYLNETFDWVIVKDSKNCLVLLPLKKEANNG